MSQDLERELTILHETLIRFHQEDRAATKSGLRTHDQGELPPLPSPLPPALVVWFLGGPDEPLERVVRRLMLTAEMCDWPCGQKHAYTQLPYASALLRTVVPMLMHRQDPAFPALLSFRWQRDEMREGQLASDLRRLSLRFHEMMTAGCGCSRLFCDKYRSAFAPPLFAD